MRTDCGELFACANIEVAAWTVMLYCASFVDSDATSTSLRVLLAEVRLFVFTESIWDANCSRSVSAPFCASMLDTSVIAVAVWLALRELRLLADRMAATPVSAIRFYCVMPTVPTDEPSSVVETASVWPAAEPNKEIPLKVLAPSVVISP